MTYETRLGRTLQNGARRGQRGTWGGQEGPVITPCEGRSVKKNVQSRHLPNRMRKEDFENQNNDDKRERDGGDEQGGK